jgi:hypothetical protein
MKKDKLMRMVLSIVTGISHGSLLAWVLTLERNDSNILFAMLSIIGLLLVFHLITSNIIGRSILIITSYLEGLLFFIVTMLAFRIGDHILGITTLSFRTEIFLFSMAAVSAILYVWAMKMVVKDG